MKNTRLFLLGVLALAAVAACSKDETPDDQGNNGNGSGTEYASISSEDSGYTATDGGGNILFGPEGGSVVITVDSNVDWNVTQEGADWLEIGVATSAGRVTVIASQTTETDDLTAKLTFCKTSNGTAFAVVNITQTAYDRPQITVDTDSWHAPAKGALTTTIDVQANAEWEVSEVSETWLSAEKTDGGLVLTVEENGQTEDREAEVTLSCTDGVTSSSLTVSVVQDGAAYLKLGGDYLSFGASESSTTVLVESNYGWDFSFDSSADWLSAEAGTDALTLTVAQYDEDGTRECIVTFTAGDGADNVAEARLTVVQKGSNPDKMILEYTVGDGTTIMLPLYDTVNCTVDWGDGSDVQSVTSVQPTHTYAESGIYNVEILGTVTRLYSSIAITDRTRSAYLTDIIQWGKTGLTSMEYALAYTGVTSLPADTEGSFSDVTTFQYAFAYCTSLAKVDAGLLAHATTANLFGYLFNGDSALEEIPSGLFDACSGGTTMNYMFQGCTSLKSIPAGLFDACTENKLASFNFDGCTGITEIPAGLFDKCSAITMLSYAFDGCSKLKTVPEGIFDGCTNATTFRWLFRNCTSLEEVPDGLFAKTKVSALDYAFYGCTALKTLPENMFGESCPVSNIRYLCYGCTSLTSLPAGLFDNCSKITNCTYAFNGCKALASESPYTEIDGVKVHLYDRGDYSSQFSTISTYSKCFTNCTKMSDYSSVPSSWK